MLLLASHNVTTTKKCNKIFKIMFVHPLCKESGIITNEFVTSSKERAIENWLKEWPGLMSCDIVSIRELPLKYTNRIHKESAA